VDDDGEVLRTLLIALAAAAGVWLIAVMILLAAGRRTAARELATLLPNLLLLFRGIVRDPRCPRGSKLLLLFALAWIASPVDLVPEFIPLLGPLDDAVVAALVLRHVIRRAGPAIVREHWRGDPTTVQRLLRLSGVDPSIRGGPGPTPS
jgi:uncharacterized membrane protein YkvA (DUF1232 family)